MRYKQFIKEDRCPDCKDGEFAVQFQKKERFKTEIAPEDRSFKNMPRYADGKGKCTFMQWLGLSGHGNTGAKGTDGKFYGWSHRAVYGFGVGDIVKPGHIGNKYQYGETIDKEYMQHMEKDGYEAADKWRDAITFEPYTIKTEEEAKQHAIRFGKDVS